MANRNNSIKETPAAILGKNPAAFHRYDNWLMPETQNNRDAQFAAAVLDVSRGAKAIAGILASHLVDLEAIHDGDSNSRPLLSAGDTEALARLAFFSLSTLHEMAVDQVDRFNTASMEGTTK